MKCCQVSTFSFDVDKIRYEDCHKHLLSDCEFCGNRHIKDLFYFRAQMNFHPPFLHLFSDLGEILKAIR